MRNVDFVLDNTRFAYYNKNKDALLTAKQPDTVGLTVSGFVMYGICNSLYQVKVQPLISKYA